ncbi:MAG: class I SAM-dependent methyltransferase [Beijerinckiaceae bacterium]
MSIDIVDLRSFYASPLGEVTRGLLLTAIRNRWESMQGLVLMGLGYATPYLGPFRDEAIRSVAMMPAAQGVVNWPSTGLSSSALVDADQLPLRDGSVDRIIVAHALEMAQDPAELMAELWRILSPGGRIIVIAPNRAGLWARMDVTPFGHGRPYSRGQLMSLMREALFTPIHWGEALYVPPVKRRVLLKTARAWDRIGRTLGLPFAGVHVIEATKQVFRPATVKKAARALPQAEPALATVGRTMSDGRRQP